MSERMTDAAMADELEDEARTLDIGGFTERAKFVRKAAAALRARQQAVAVEGFVMVPVEPTFAMRCAFREADEDATDRALGPAFNIAYRALLAASQSAGEKP